jgi:catechol 2,3-dioxygenase-like lactoylglutathione lyase family enzyme
MKSSDAPIAKKGFFVTHFLTVKDQARSKEFYVGILGGKVVKPFQTDLSLRACNPRVIRDPIGFTGLFEATICRALRLLAAESRLPIPKA